MSCREESRLALIVGMGGDEPFENVDAGVRFMVGFLQRI